MKFSVLSRINLLSQCLICQYKFNGKYNEKNPKFRKSHNAPSTSSLNTSGSLYASYLPPFSRVGLQEMFVVNAMIQLEML